MSDQGFEQDLILEPRRSARKAWIVASVASGLAVLQGLALVLVLPLQKTEVFSVLVDKTTGQAERIVQVQPTGISDEQAVKEALLISYVNDRESYIRAGIQERLESVQRRSTDTASESLLRLWTNSSSNPDYPPTIYGAGAEVAINIKAINFLSPNVAQVRFEKTLRRPRQDPIKRSFIATIGFEFDPRQERQLQLVWENPLGFIVNNYAVSAETLGG